jgi:hypothetical protein
VTEAYIDELVLALRLRDVPGDRIGEVVAEVEARVAESGEDPAVAFGPPEAYALEVAAGVRRRRPSPVDLLRAYPPVLGAMLLVDSLSAVFAGRRAAVTAGEVVVFAVLPPLAALLLRPGVRRSPRIWAGAGLGAAGLVAVLFLGAGLVLVRYPAWIGLVVGAALLAGGYWLLRPDQGTDREGGAPVGEPRRHRARRARGS